MYDVDSSCLFAVVDSCWCKMHNLYVNWCGMYLPWMVIYVVRSLCFLDGRILFVTMCEFVMLIEGLWRVRVHCNGTSRGETFPLMLMDFPSMKIQQHPCKLSWVTTLNEAANTIETLKPKDVVHIRWTPLLNILRFLLYDCLHVFLLIIYACVFINSLKNEILTHQPK